MVYGKPRNSKRLKESQRSRVVDESARQRRLRKMHEMLEQDNHHDDPYADWSMSKKAPKFEDSFALRPKRQSTKTPAKTPAKSAKSKKNLKKDRNPNYFQIKYRKMFSQNVEEDFQEGIDHKRPSYAEIVAPQSAYPSYNSCAVCGYQGSYNCVSCGMKICQPKCFDMHYETRCTKFTNVNYMAR